MFEIPEAEPTWSADTAAVEPEEAGPLEMPRPTESTSSGAMNAAYAHDASTNASAAKPAVARTKPSASARADQDRQRRAHQHLVAQQVQVHQRSADALLDVHEQHERHDRHGEAAER